MEKYDLVDNFMLSIVGPRNRGKSFLVKQMITYFLKNNKFKEKHIIIINPSIEINDDYMFLTQAIKISETKKQYILDILNEQIDNIKMYGKKKTPKILLILDDCANSHLFRNGGIIETISMRGRHANISCIITSQTLHSITKKVRLNSDYIILFSPYVVRELEGFIEEFCVKDDRKKIIKRFLDIFDTKYNYVVINNNEHCYKKKITLKFKEIIKID